MSTAAFDAFTRHAAGGLSRRTSLLTLGGAAAAVAALTQPPISIAKKGGKKRRRRKKDPFKQCKRQVEQCEDFLKALCGDEPTEVCEAQILCCEFLGTCDIGEFIDCLNEAIENND